MDIDGRNHERIDFCTLGMFIIDEICPSREAEDQTPRLNVIGGGGTYSAIGARLLSPPPPSRSVGWIVDAGTDFPDGLRSVIASWDTGVLLRERDALTTRGWNGYGKNEHRAFKYLTPKKRLTAHDLTPELLRARSFHFLCSPSRCMEMSRELLRRRRESFSDSEPRPVIIWEPVPDLCIASELGNTYEALRSVDVVSPNHEELAALVGYYHSTGVDKAAVEEHAALLLEHGIGPSRAGSVVVRAGKEGCYITSPKASRWLPAYHQDSTKVVDPTGGGNGFLGGLALGLVRTGGDLVEAARYGSISASFCIEQVGVPTLKPAHECEDSVEKWNGCAVLERLNEYRERTQP